MVYNQLDMLFVCQMTLSDSPIFVPRNDHVCQIGFMESYMPYDTQITTNKPNIA